MRGSPKCSVAFHVDGVLHAGLEMPVHLAVSQGTHSPLGHTHRSESRAVVSWLSFASPGHAWHRMEVQYMEEGWHARVHQLQDAFTFAGTLAAAWRHWNSFFSAWSSPIHISA